jgi:hypothetical protein
MSDRNKRAPQGSKRTKMNHEHEVRYWPQRFGFTCDQFRLAVDAMVDAVERRGKSA